MSTDRRIEIVAEAMWANRWQRSTHSWDRFKINHPDIAEIYRENAQVAIAALAKAAQPQHRP